MQIGKIASIMMFKTWSEKKTREMDEKIESTLASLKQNGIEAWYIEDVEIASKKILELIPRGVTVGIGDSVSVRQLSVLEELETKGRVLVNPFSKDISRSTNRGEITRDERRKIHRLALNCEFFLTGTNAVTLDGKLINTDASGNRVAGMVFGPEKVVIIVGKNKIVRDLDQALYRIRNVIAPHHAKMRERHTPCVNTGNCTNCKSKERICNVTVMIKKKPSYTKLMVLIVDEDLGLGWDENWSAERINKIYSNYSKFTWLKRPKWLD